MNNSKAVFICLFISGILILNCRQTKASHAFGIDLSYQCVGVDSFQFSLAFYRDCDGVTAPTSVLLDFNSDTCVQSFTDNLALTEVSEISPICDALYSNGICHGGTLGPGVEKYIYTGLVTMPDACTDWKISYGICCRTSSIDNLFDPSTQEIYVEAMLNNFDYPCNSSPSFTIDPAPASCDSVLFQYNTGVVELDGDSLSYSLVAPLSGPGASIPFIGGNTTQNPLPTTGGVAFDPQTGQLAFEGVVLSPPQEVSVYALLVEEFRNGILIGSVMRDVMLIVETGCNNQGPVFSGITNVSPGVTVVNNSEINLCPLTPIYFEIWTVDPNAGDSVFISDNSALAITGSSITHQRVSADSILSVFQWTPTITEQGFYSFVINAVDNNCPLKATQIQSIKINILSEAALGPDQTYCQAGGPQQIDVIGQGPFTWTPTTGIVQANVDSSVIWVAPSQTTQYIVSNPNLGSCSSSDTIVIHVASSFSYQISPPDSICIGQASQLQFTADPTFAPYTYQWSPHADLSAGNVSNPSATPITSTTYYITATAQNGCSIEDSTRVVVVGNEPSVLITGNQYLCLGDSTQLDAVVCHNGISDFFNSTINAAIWEFNLGTVNDWCGSFSPPNALYFNSVALREARTVPLNITPNTNLSFALKMGDGSNPCENADINEGVYLEYSTNGVTWTTIFYYDPDVYTIWHKHLWNIGTDVPGAISATTQFRWIQITNSGLGFDNWALDDVEIDCCSDQCYSFVYSWSPASSLSASNIANPLASPTVSTQYILSVSPIGTSCIVQDTFDVVVGPGFNWTQSADDTICLGGSAQLWVQPDINHGPFTYEWSPSHSLTSPFSSTTIATPDTTTTYQVAMLSDSGCRDLAEVTVAVFNHGREVHVTASDDNLCPGENVVLGSTLQLVTCGFSSNTNCLGSTQFTHVGSSNNVNFGTPFQGTANSGKWQTLITAHELQTDGVSSGNIFGLSLLIDSVQSTSPYFQFQMSLGCTADSMLSTNNGWVTGLTQVYGPVTFSAATGLNTFNFTHPYGWDGFSNLVIEICWVNPAGVIPGGSDELLGVPTGEVRTVRNYQNTTLGCSLSPLFTYAMRPYVIFQHCTPPTTNLSYQWTPASMVSTPNQPNTVALVNQSTTFTLEVSDTNGCVSTDTVSVNIDSTYYLNLPSDTFTPPGVPIQIEAEIIGNPPSGNLVCGDTGTICNGTYISTEVSSGNMFLDGFTYPAPFGNWYWGARHQFLYKANELYSEGITNPSTINSISFNVAQVIGINNYTDFTVKMGCASMNGISTWQTNMTTVFDPKSVSISQGWVTLNFDREFDWDGVSDLIIETCFNQTTFSNNSPVMLSQTPYNSSIYYRQDATGICGITLVTGVSNQRPNVQFSTCDAPTTNYVYQWSPPTALSSDTIPNPVAAPTSTTTYTLSVTYPNGCVHSDTIRVWTDTICPAPSQIWHSFVQLSGARLNWQPVANVHHYQLRGRILGGIWTEVNMPSNSTFMNASNLVPYTYYEWQIRAFCGSNGQDTSSWSILDTFRTACYGPDSTWTNPVSFNGARLNWISSPGAHGYEIRGQRIGAPVWTTIVVGPGNPFKDVFGLQPGFSYRWAIRSLCDAQANNSSGWSELDTFTTLQVSNSRLALEPTSESGFGEDVANSFGELKIWPNPADEVIHLEWHGVGKAEISVWSMEGNQITQKSVIGHSSLHIADWPAGVYILELKSGEEIHRRKIIVE